jgi:prepilin-type N-terminal cleavage/methylation domain-containing protein
MRNRFAPHGFTLVELLLVVLLLSSLALLATTFVDNADRQMKFDLTRARLEQMRKAIVGDFSRTLNGEPMLSGFVADMGRLPTSLSELIEPPTDSDLLWGPIALSSEGIDGTLYGGWRGPYLDPENMTVNPFDPEDDDLYRVFRDGWGNLGADENADKENYGWGFQIDDGKIIVQSYGADLTSGDGDDVYDKDFPPAGEPLIGTSDWRVDVTGNEIRVALNRMASSSADNLELRLYWLETGDTSKDIKKIEDIGAIPLTAPLNIPGQQTLSGNFPIPSNPEERVYLPVGTIAAVVVCVSSEDIYKGDCATPPSLSPRVQYLKISPRAYHPPLTIEWNTQ